MRRAHARPGAAGDGFPQEPDRPGRLFLWAPWARSKSFFATLEGELLARRRFVTQAEPRLVVFDYDEGWYHPATLGM